MLLPGDVLLRSAGDFSSGGISRRSFLTLLLVVAFGMSTSASHLHAQALAGPFSGRWDLTLKGTSKDLPSWIDVSEEQGQLKVVLVGPTDHAMRLKQAEIKSGELTFVSLKGEQGFDADTTYKAKLAGGRLVGTVTNSQHTWQLLGTRAPALSETKDPKWGTPVHLFDGKSLAGWRLSDPSKNSWEVLDGTLVSNGHGSEIIGIPKFFDFQLHVDFNAGTNANSGIFLRGRYEVQIETESASEPPSHHTGGVYGYLDPTPEQPRKADQWQSFDITFVGRTVTVVQNGVMVIDHKEIPGITGGALDSNEALPGPIYLQGSEAGRVAFRNIVLTPAQK